VKRGGDDVVRLGRRNRPRVLEAGRVMRIGLPVDPAALRDRAPGNLGAEPCRVEVVYNVAALLRGDLLTRERLMCWQGATVTIDAAGCQTEIARRIVDAGGHYVRDVRKGNADANFNILRRIASGP
jgi:hypothetical protein